MSTLTPPEAAAPVEAPASSAPTRGRPVAFGYIPALDGLRAVSVLGLMLYHGGVPAASGGFLTIDVFFVLSGFLITSLLLGEWAQRLTLRLGQFWARRARRLLPALLLMLVVVALAARVLAVPGEYGGFRLDALSALFYVSNWHFIATGSDYFAMTAQPSPLQHLWSLSIEEQFYLVWPPVMLGLLHLGRRLRPTRRLWPVLAAAVAGALASALDMALSYRSGASVMRLYEGTDTRAQDVLVGAVLAIALAMWARHRPVAAPARHPATRSHPSAGTVGEHPPRSSHRDLHRRRGPGVRPVTAWEITRPPVRLVVQVAAWVAAGWAVFLCNWLTGPGAFLFQGGYLAFAVGVAVVIFGVVTGQASALSRALGNSVFRYLGRISYGVYLWHFPVFAFVDGERLHLYGYALLAVRIAVTLVVATASYYAVEEPIRRRRAGALTEWRAWLAGAGAIVAVVVVTVAATLPATVEAAGAVRARGADYTGPPVRVLVVGDSVAWRLAFAVQVSQPQDAYDVDIDNGAIVGCGVVRSTAYRAHGVVEPESRAGNSGAPASQQWPAEWRGELDQFRPDVVVLLAGRWEMADRLIDGRWQHIGQPAYDRVLDRALDQAVQVATSTGAVLDLLTSPCYDSGEQPGGQPWPEDSAARLAAYNAAVRRVAAAHPSTVHLDDFGSLLCPGGRFTPTIGGVQVRDGDGVHIEPTEAAGRWLDARLLPEVVHLGRLQVSQGSLVATTVPGAGAPTGSGGPGGRLTP